jgi:uncharacterized protein with HEPN domain
VKRRELAYLNDILLAIDDCAGHLTGIADYPVYHEQKTIRRAVERELEIIGESMCCAAIDPVMIFKTATIFVPELRPRIVELMERFKNA